MLQTIRNEWIHGNYHQLEREKVAINLICNQFWLRLVPRSRRFIPIYPVAHGGFPKTKRPQDHWILYEQWPYKDLDDNLGSPVSRNTVRWISDLQKTKKNVHPPRIQSEFSHQGFGRSWNGWCCTTYTSLQSMHEEGWISLNQSQNFLDHVAKYES